MPIFRPSAVLRLYAVLACLLGLPGAHARVIEEQITVPVEVRDEQGHQVAQSIVVAVFRDDEAPRPYPMLVLNHGDGHMLFSRAPNLRQPAVEAFLRRQGFVPFAHRASWQ